MQFLRERYSGETIIAVGHDSSNRILLLSVLDMPLSKYWNFRQDPCSIDIVEFHDSGVTVNKINETAHLGRLKAEHQASDGT